MESVPRCPSCGSETGDAANFCPVCGARLAAQGGETRRLVTVLFCDMVASTSIGTSLDSEVMRLLMSRFFERVRTPIERHGGTVEKFIGDAVMAVFGLPDLHEDDALRAARAALDVRAAVQELSQSVEPQFGRSLQIRIGLNTGEVVASDDPGGQRLVTGDAVNLAARLEQAAEPGDILIGPLTYHLIRHAAQADPVGPISVKGLAAPVVAHRLTRVLADEPPRTAERLLGFVGRNAELRQLGSRFAAACEERGCQLVTVIGPAGIGKSRLVHEFLAGLGDRATVLRGRCLPYGEGITYWPISSIVKTAALIDDADDTSTARRRLDQTTATVSDGTTIGEALAAAIGLDPDANASREQISWAFRRFLESLAAVKPLVAVIDDIQWGDATLLDLLESIAALSSNAPILLLCLARPDLAERRAGWGTGLPNALTLELEPLSDEDSGVLIQSLADNARVPNETVNRLREAAEGNPLFLEELMTMFVEEGLLKRVEDHWEAVGDPRTLQVPATVKALLAARLDRLPADDRLVAQRAAVVGRIFERGAVIELSPESERPHVERNLVSLVRREVIRPDARGMGGHDTFRFRHLLVRDAAYDRLSKQERSELHHRFANWLERTIGDRLAEVEEILGYHLEQAYSYRQELGHADAITAEMAERAAVHLGRAARRAWDRSDFPAVVSLLHRAMAAVGHSDPRWPEWAADSVDALVELGDEATARKLVDEMVLVASGALDRGSRAWAAVARTHFETFFGGFNPATAADDLAQAIDDFTAAQDERGLARAWLRSAWVPWLYMKVAEAGQRVTRALEHAQAGGSRGDEINTLAFLTNVLVWGPAPVPEARAAYDDILRNAGSDRRLQAHVARGRAVLLAMEGRLEDASAEYERCVKSLRDLGLTLAVAESAQLGAYVLAWNGEIAAAADLLAGAAVELEYLKEQGYLSTHRAMLARFLADLGRLDEAESQAVAARDMEQRDDLTTDALWRSSLALVHSRRGNLVEADRLSLEAVLLVQTSDAWIYADAFVARAEVLATAGRDTEAQDAMARAIDIFRAKGATAVAQRLEVVRLA